MIAAFRAAEAGTAEWPPPIVVHRDPDMLRMRDGHHRLAAARLAGVRSIRVIFSDRRVLSEAMEKGSLSEIRKALMRHVRRQRRSP